MAKYFLILFAVIFFVGDRFFKNLFLKLPPETGVFDTNFFKLQTTLNPHAAFSLPLPNLAAIILSSIIIVILIYFFWQNIKNIFLAGSLILIISGALSNLLDRIKFGGVIDFIAFDFWPSFNLADAYIVTGSLLLFFIYFKSSSAMTKTASAGKEKQEDSK